jgi:hypothetical protein
VLVDQRGPSRGAAHPVHQFSEGRACFTSKDVAGMAEVVKVETGQARRRGSLRPLLRRRFTSTDPRTGNLLSDSVSYIPKAFVEANPAILDERNKPWQGGTLHQLSTVGIEIMKVVDEVTARMPSSSEADSWDLPSGIPLLFCRRLSYDHADTLIEISDAWYPADRTELRFVTPLTPWPNPPQKRKK